MKRLLLFTLCCLMLTTLSAEVMNVITTEVNTIELASVQGISFSNEVLSIALDTGETETFELTDIIEITFGEYVSVQDMANIISKIPIKFLKNYPNPFNPSTKISFQLTEPGKTKVEIYNVKGQKVKTLLNENRNQGYHTIVWNGDDNNNNTVASGVYFYKVSLNGKENINKMIMVK